MIETYKSEFGYLEKKHMIILILYAVLCAISYAFSYTSITQLIILAFQCITAITNPFLCLAGSITVTLYSGEIFLGYVQILLQAMIVVGFFLKKIKMLRALNNGKLILLSFVLIIISFILGESPDKNTMILMLLCLFRIAVLLNINFDKNISVVTFGYISAGISIILYFFLGIFQGSSIITYGRLSFEGDIKSVAIATAIPMIMILLTRLEGKKVFNNFNYVVFDYVLVIMLGIVTALTLARGVLIAIVLALLSYMFFTGRKMSGIIKFLPILVIVIFIMLSYIDTSTFRLERLFASEEYASVSGRADIWRYYIDLVIHSGPLHVLFGMGPGNINRIGNLDYYAHSTFLDFFFSYGVVGFIVFIISEFRLLVIFIRSKEPVVIGLFVLSVIMYIGHGVSNNTTMFTLQILLLQIVNSKSRYVGGQDDGQIINAT